MENSSGRPVVILGIFHISNLESRNGQRVSLPDLYRKIPQMRDIQRTVIQYSKKFCGPNLGNKSTHMRKNMSPLEGSQKEVWSPGPQRFDGVHGFRSGPTDESLGFSSFILSVWAPFEANLQTMKCHYWNTCRNLTLWDHTTLHSFFCCFRRLRHVSWKRLSFVWCKARMGKSLIPSFWAPHWTWTRTELKKKRWERSSKKRAGHLCPLKKEML